MSLQQRMPRATLAQRIVPTKTLSIRVYSGCDLAESRRPVEGKMFAQESSARCGEERKVPEATTEAMWKMWLALGECMAWVSEE